MARERAFRSEGERKVAAALGQYGIPYVYEQELPIRDSHRIRRLKPDFHLPTVNAYVEYFGRAGNDSYDRRTQQKMRLYTANRITVIPIYPWDLCRSWPRPLYDGLDRITTSREPQRTAQDGYARAAYAGATRPLDHRTVNRYR